MFDFQLNNFERIEENQRLKFLDRIALKVLRLKSMNYIFIKTFESISIRLISIRIKSLHRISDNRV